jgi:hypothetical protein
MKKHQLLLLTLFFLIYYSNAAIYRVNNQAGVDADFTTLLAAINGASNGDILLVEGSPTNYTGDIAIYKRLTIIGPGNFLTSNPNTQANPVPATFDGRLTFHEAASNSVVMGLSFYSGTANNIRIVGADNVTVRRNYFNTIPNSQKTVVIDGGSYNIIVEQNWMISSVNWGSGEVIEVNSPCSVIIRNNYIEQMTAGKTAISTDNNGSNSVTIQNNVIAGYVEAYYCAFFNNIYRSGSFLNGGGNIIANNLCNSTQFPANNGNIQNVNMNTVFVSNGGSVDNNYQLASGSPAIGAASGGGDCGMYSADSGGNPYVLSTMPPVPSITSVSMPPIATTTLPVTIQAVSHN